MNDNLDPGIPVLRMILIVAWGCICFGAGTLYAPNSKFAACVEVPTKMPEYPRTKAEIRKFIAEHQTRGRV